MNRAKTRPPRRCEKWARKPVWLNLLVRGSIESIDWYFRFRGQLIHKICEFFLVETTESTTSPQHAEGITACRWIEFDAAESLISYANARSVLRRAREMVLESSTSAGS